MGKRDNLQIDIPKEWNTCKYKCNSKGSREELVIKLAKRAIEDVKLGNDKPLKYPSMFQRSSVVILNKIDMVHLTDFNKEEFYRDVNYLNKDIKVVDVSCRKNRGLSELT